MKRTGFSAIVIVIAVAVILMISASAQQYVSGNVKRRVAVAEAGRRCLIQATTAVEEGIEMLVSELNEPPGETDGQASMARQFRQLTPGQVLDFSYRPRAAAIPGDGPPVKVSMVQGSAFIVDVEGERGTPPRGFNCRKYKEFLLHWNSVPG